MRRTALSFSLILLLSLVGGMVVGTPARADFAEGLKAYERGNFNRAFALAQIEAQKGNPEAQAYLGIMYQFGQATRRDVREAARWYALGADGGHTQAQINLGVLLASGQGVERDMVAALKWFTIAAESPGTIAEQNRLLAIRTMTKKQIKKAEDLAAKWLKAHGKEKK